MRQFIVGTGGTRLDSLGAPLANTEVQNNTAFGVLQLGLHDGSYDWQFVPQPGKTFTDSGSTACSPLAPVETSLDGGPIGAVGSNSASFTFSSNTPDAEFRCSLDDGPYSLCSSPHEYTGLSEGDHTFRVKAIDAAGNEDVTPAARTWTVAVNNLLSNGRFEGSLSGWYPYKATAALANGGPEGLTFARVTPNAGEPIYSLNTAPRPVSSSEASVRYQASGWLRSETPGQKVCLSIRERVGTTVVKNTASCQKTTSEWERFAPATHLAVGAGSLEVFASRSNAVSGDSFDLDGLTLVRLP